MSLTIRQKNILGSVISEFLNTSSSVGSVTLFDKYDIGVSPATLRSEMAKLVSEGYLYKPHSSSGRLPTTLGLRLFIDEMLDEKEIDLLKATRLKEKIFKNRFNRVTLLKESVKALSELSSLPSIIIVEELSLLYGIGHLLKHHDFEDIENLENIIHVLEDEVFLSSLFSKLLNDKKLRIVVGDETGIKTLSNCSIVYSKFNYFRGEEGFIACVGPRSMPYDIVIPSVRMLSDFIDDTVRGWD